MAENSGFDGPSRQVYRLLGPSNMDIQTARGPVEDAFLGGASTPEEKLMNLQLRTNSNSLSGEDITDNDQNLIGITARVGDQQQTLDVGKGNPKIMISNRR